MNTITCPPAVARWIEGTVVLINLELIECATTITVPDSWDDTPAVRAAQQQVEALTVRAGRLLRHSTQPDYTDDEQRMVRDVAASVARFAEDVVDAVRALRDVHDSRILTPGP